MTLQRSPYAAMDAAPRSPVLAAVLSFFIPGLGQVYAGQLLRGLLIAVPQTVVIVVLGWLYLDDPIRLGATLVVNGIALAILNVLLLLYRAYAVVDAYRVASDGRTSLSRQTVAAGIVALAVLLTADVAVHGFAAYTSFKLNDTLTAISPDCEDIDPDLPRPRDCPTPTPRPTPSTTPSPTEPGSTPTPVAPTEPGATPSPTPTPVPTLPPGTPYWAADGRLDVLLLGADQGEGRTGLRTDTMIVGSLDIATGRSALFGIPRNVRNVPLPDSLETDNACHCFRPYLSGLITFFRQGDVRFVDGSDDAFRALAETIEGLLGIKLDGIVLVNLTGFVAAVDALGGITMNVPEAVYEAGYRNELGQRELVEIKPGIQHMDGHTALKYVRSRHQDSDYGRMGRQQNFLRAVRAQFTACNIIPRLPSLLDAMKDAVRTDIPLEEVPGLIELVSRSRQPRRFEFTPQNRFGSDWSKPALLGRLRQTVANGFDPKNPDAEPDPEESLAPPPGNPC